MERVLRAIAIVIAVLGLIDPAVTSNRTERPLLALVDASAASGAANAGDARASHVLVERTRTLLARDFTVVSAPFANASGTVVVGDRLPPRASALATPLFVVLPDTIGARVHIEQLHAPRRVTIESRAVLHARLHVHGARGRDVSVTLRSGSLLVDSITHHVTADDERAAVELAYTPTSTGIVPLVLTATLDRASGGVATRVATNGATTNGALTGVAATASVVLDVTDRRLSVLVYDARPSWMSTFVRRAIERDRRFAVTSRVVTSRNISTDAGRPPVSFDDAGALAAYDVIILGAPEALTPRDVAGMERYLRRRGGSVLLLFDRASPGAYTRLTGDVRWNRATSATARAVVATDIERLPDSVAMRVTDFMVPSAEVAGSQVMARLRPSVGDRAPVRALVWSVAVGAGRLIVSGALDAWRFRDATISSFDRFWQGQVAAAAEASPPVLLLETSNRLVAPNEWVDLTVTLRELALAAREVSGVLRATVSVVLRSGSSTGQERIRVWPAGPVGRFHGVFRAPRAEGQYVLTARSGGATVDAPIVVSAAATAISTDDASVVATWAAARGGSAVSATQLESLRPVVTRTLRPIARAVTWHPMRSAWWIIPFSFLLGAEWWLRRRSGLA